MIRTSLPSGIESIQRRRRSKVFATLPPNSETHTDTPSPTEWIGCGEALTILPVKPATLYTYVSRGLVRRMKGRTRGSLFSRADIEQLKAQRDAHATNALRAVAALRWGEPVVVTAITELRPEGPVYRGVAALELARQGVRFESVCALLWNEPEPYAAITWPAHDQEPLAETLRPLAALPGSDPMKVLAAATLLLPMLEDEVTPPAGDDRTIAAAQRLIRALAAACSMTLRPPQVVEPSVEDPVAAVLARALGLEPTPPVVAALNAALVLAADHELAPGAFAARVAASAGADLHASVAAGICAHSGTVVGKACREAEQLIARLSDDDIPQAVSQVVSQGTRRYGFNHPLYRKGDPRTAYLVDIARTFDPLPEPVRRAIACVDAAEAAGAHAGIAMGLVVLAGALQAPAGAALLIWTVSRSAGLVAHAVEQALDGYQLRPRARFVAS